MKSYQILNIHSRTIAELNYQVLLSYQEASLRCKRFKRDCRSKSHIWHEIYFCFFLKIWYCFVNPIFVKQVSYYIRRSSPISTFSFVTDIHIDERRRIKKEEQPQAFAKVHSDIVEIFFHICNPLCENWTSDGKWNFYLVTFPNRRIFYLSFEPLNVCIECTITKIQLLKPGQSKRDH